VLYSPGLRFTLIGFAGFLLVVAMTLAPLSTGINALGESAYMATVAILGLAVVPRRGKEPAFRLGFAATGGIFLLVSGWFFIPGVAGRPDLGRVFQAASAIAFGILGGLLARRLAATVRGVERLASSPPRASQ
jgi:hypothetical protein